MPLMTSTAPDQSAPDPTAGADLGAFLDAALDLAAERGWPAVSAGEVAARCGVEARVLGGVGPFRPRLLARLEHHGARATFFVVGELADEVAGLLDPAGPHEVGSHGLDHAVLTRLAPDAVQRQLEESRHRLHAAGYAVTGFRAPFFRRPADLDARLWRCGYRYDASHGSVWPSPANRARPRPASPEQERPARLGNATLRDGLLPFNLTWLRLLHPFGRRWIAPRAGVFSCHLHELLPRDGIGESGLPGLPAALRRLHAKAAGDTAWSLVEGLLADPSRRFVTARERLDDGRG